MYLFPTVSVLSGFGSSAPVRQRRLSESSMKKELKVKEDRDLRQEYDLSKMRRAFEASTTAARTATTNLVNIFPDAESVNRALRVIAEAAQSAKSSGRRRTRSH